MINICLFNWREHFLHYSYACQMKCAFFTVSEEHVALVTCINVKLHITKMLVNKLLLYFFLLYYYAVDILHVMNFKEELCLRILAHLKRRTRRYL